MSKANEGGAKGARQAPDEIKLKERQSQRLAALSGIEAKKLQGATVAELAQNLRWRVDPELLLMRRVCGQVVKTDPASGVDLPVPFATVNVYDTDCDFIGYFPFDLPWAWFYPIFCSRELIATATTDACGKFCVWIPRFDIDWIVRWRLEWECDPEIWIKPSIADLIRRLHLVATDDNPIPPHGPGPVSAGTLARDGGRALQKLTDLLGPARGLQLQLAVRNAMTMGKGADARSNLDRPAFSKPLPPPLSPQLAELGSRFAKEGAKALAVQLNVEAPRKHSLDLHRYVGPFLRWNCHLSLEREIVPILDVPDISFEVTQDVNGDGTQEVIYGNGYFDVAWNSGPIADVTLHASQSAVATWSCGPMPEVDCGQLGAGVGIVSASLMPLSGPAAGTPYYDAASGYGRRVNPPHADGAIRGSVAADRPATAPFARTLLLRGCNQVQNGAFYRLLYRFNGGPESPLIVPAWPTFRPLANTPVWVSGDANGWHAVLPDPANWLVPYLLLAWPTRGFQDGSYSVRLEIANAAKAHLSYSQPVRFEIDNSTPTAAFLGLAWRVAQNNTLPCTDPSWTPLPLHCPVVRRNVGDAIEFCVTWQASASHLREAALYGYGCGAASAVLTKTTSDDSVGHWHTGPADNNVTRSAIFRLNYAPDNQGAYGFGVNAYSRCFDPGDTTGYVADWLYDIAWYGGTMAALSVAVVNA
ncbi:MAG TPA: hypothetical protein VF816_17370 [Rhodocyclaceae bacterium]